MYKGGLKMSATTNVQFSDYRFPYNPRTIEVAYKPRLLSFFTPITGIVVKHMGVNSKVIVCEGELFSDTTEETKRLLEDMIQIASYQKSGALFIPCEKPMVAFVSDFKYIAKGDGRVIHYRIEFLESFQK